LHVCSDVIIGEQLNGFSLNLILGSFARIRRRIRLITVQQQQKFTLHEDLHAFCSLKRLCKDFPVYLEFAGKYRLRVFENGVLRRIFGPKRDEVTGEWRNLRSEELHNLYSSPNIISHIKSGRMRLAGLVARMGQEIKLYKVLVGKPEGKRPLGRPKRRWEDGIRMDLRETGLGVWIGFDWLRIGTGGGLL
jgi:hypothetical protein